MTENFLQKTNRLAPMNMFCLLISLWIYFSFIHVNDNCFKFIIIDVTYFKYVFFIWFGKLIKKIPFHLFPYVRWNFVFTCFLIMLCQPHTKFLSNKITSTFGNVCVNVETRRLPPSDKKIHFPVQGKSLPVVSSGFRMP